MDGAEYRLLLHVALGQVRKFVQISRAKEDLDGLEQCIPPFE